MPNFFPLIANATANVIQEIPAGSLLDLSQSGIANSGNISVSGAVSATGNITANYFVGNGSLLTGISGGTSNTGNVTFNDQVIQGTGDQYGGGGLYLAPGTESTGNLQYLRVRGGDYPTHIHFDTGNRDYYDQYFGDDSKYVKLEAGDEGNVNIGTFSGNTGSSAWSFDNQGALNLPNNGVVRQDGPVNIVATDYSQLQWVDSGNINIPDPNGSDGPKNWAYVDVGGFSVETNLNTGTGSSHSLYFNNDGELLFDGGLLNIYSNVSYFGANVSLISPQAGQGMITQALGNTATASMIWVENAGNALAGNVTAVYANPLPDSGMLRITTGSPSGSQYLWDFDVRGRTILPYLNTQRGDNPSGTVSGYTLRIGDGNYEAIITTPDGDADGNPNSQRLVINPGKGADTTYGEGGDIYLWAGRGGDAGGTGGDIKIRGGQGMLDGSGGYIRVEGGDSQGAGAGGYITLIGGTSANSTGGYVQIQSGQGVAGANIDLTGGTGTAGPGGSINITGGVSANGLAEYGNIFIHAGASTWTFDNGGNLTLPDGTSFQNFGPGSAEWHAGANGYVSLASNNGNTYMWVDNNGAYIGTNWIPGSYTWTFGNTGSMTAPGAINVGNMSIGELPGYITAEANTGIILNVSGPDGGFVVDYLKEDGNANTSQGELALNSELGNTTYRISLTDDAGDGFATKIWRFDGTGTLTVPGEGVIQSLNDTVILQSKDTGTGNIVTARLGTNGGLYFEGTEYPNGWLSFTNNAGNANITAASGTSGAAGKNIYITAGAADQNDFYTTPGGDVNIIGGLGAFNDGGGGGPGGNVNITAGVSSDPAGHAGNINITAGSNSWVFDYSGVVNLPGGTGTIETYANNISIYSDTAQVNGMLMYDTGTEIYALQDFAIFTDNANASHIWRFYANATMSAPGDINAAGNISAGNFIGGGSNVELVAGTSSWTFETPGRSVWPVVPLANLTVVAGGRAFINDANLIAAGNFGQQVGSGGSNTVPVWSDGTNWYIG